MSVTNRGPEAPYEFESAYNNQTPRHFSDSELQQLLHQPSTSQLQAANLLLEHAHGASDPDTASTYLADAQTRFMNVALSSHDHDTITHADRVRAQLALGQLPKHKHIITTQTLPDYRTNDTAYQSTLTVARAAQLLYGAGHLEKQDRMKLRGALAEVVVFALVERQTLTLGGPNLPTDSVVMSSLYSGDHANRHMNSAQNNAWDIEVITPGRNDIQTAHKLQIKASEGRNPQPDATNITTVFLEKDVALPSDKVRKRYVTPILHDLILEQKTHDPDATKRLFARTAMINQVIRPLPTPPGYSYPGSAKKHSNS